MIAGSRVRELLSVHGEVRPQAASEWKGEFPLPSAVERFYLDVGPVDIEIEGYGNPTFLPALSDLWEFQAGYRWHGATGERLAAWDDDWLVVASEGGDPYICSRSSGRILIAMHGTGEWDPSELFADLNAMAGSLAVLGAIIRDAGLLFTDDQSNIRPEYRVLAQQRLGEILPSQEAIDAVLGDLGWG